MSKLNVHIMTICFLIPTMCLGQGLCERVYLWDFKTSENERNNITRTITNEIEDILSTIEDCIVLQRRKYSEIQQQIDNEIQIFSVEGISSSLKSELRTIEAKRVLFGEISQDFSFNVNLRLRLEHLATKQIKTGSILIEGDQMIDPEKRKEKLQIGLIKLLDLTGYNNQLSPRRGDVETQRINDKSNTIKIGDFGGRVLPVDPVNAIATSTYVGYPANNSIDDNIDTYWCTDNGDQVGAEIKFLFSDLIELHRLDLKIPDNLQISSPSNITILDKNGNSQNIRLLWNTKEISIPIDLMISDEFTISINKIEDSDGSYSGIYDVRFFGRRNSNDSNKPDAYNKVVKPVSIEESSIWGDDINYSGKMAVDGNLSTAWFSKNGRIKDEYLKFNFSNKVAISKIKIYRPSNHDGASIKEIKVYYPDNTFQIAEYRGLEGWDELTIDPVETNQIEIVIKDVFNSKKYTYLSIYDMQFYE